VVGGERASEDMGETRGLTSRPRLPTGERRERERGGAADGWGPAVRRGRAKLGRGRERGGPGVREGGVAWAGTWPSRGGESFSFFYFYFLFLILIFYFYFFLSPFLLNNNLLNNLRC
jgi:hypothetical protein